ncbi:MAG: hypothetical protein AAGB04_02870 [Pseudomonadota bacterium]
MADVRQEPIRWRKHRSWSYYAWILAATGSVAFAAQWLVSQF